MYTQSRSGWIKRDISNQHNRITLRLDSVKSLHYDSDEKKPAAKHVTLKQKK